MVEQEQSKFQKFVNKFKQLWKDKRYKSLMILLMYLIFFIVIFSILNFDSSKVQSNYEKTIEFKDYNMYDFSMELNINEFVYELSGNRYQNKYEFVFDNQNFDMTYEEIRKSNLDINIINTFEFTPYFINNIIENSELISEKKVLATNEIVKEYSLDLSKYLQILDYNLDIYDSNDTIIIMVTENNNQINSITLDLTNFYKNLEEAYQEYKITINYSNLNNN